MENELEKIVESEFQKYENWYSGNFEHETETEYEPYGDTFVSVGTYVTDESEKKCKEEFKQDFNLNIFLTEYLAENEDFANLIYKILQKRKLME